MTNAFPQHPDREPSGQAQAPARRSSASDAALSPAPLSLRPPSESRIPPIPQTRMQAWESMERARHKVDRLRAHYESAIARADPSLADSLAPDLFTADEEFRRAEKKLLTFTPSPRRKLAFSADPNLNLGCWALLWLGILSNLPFLLGLIIFLLALVVIALFALIGVL